jgi:hypothetical protein
MSQIKFWLEKGPKLIFLSIFVDVLDVQLWDTLRVLLSELLDDEVFHDGFGVYGTRFYVHFLNVFKLKLSEKKSWFKFF